VGDEVIVLSYAEFPDEQAQAHEPRVVWVDENNRVKAEKE
jgi:aspartate 1-decarboxylase